ncbi:hypothetical protein [Moorena sp. SIO3B2]|nr:hypothetical protein [Moorena sp. SIO3B2]NEQ12415.1 hypothetical protein [Moorena sp. SIO3E2]
MCDRDRTNRVRDWPLATLRVRIHNIIDYKIPLAIGNRAILLLISLER